ncbi:hypothetical protein JZ785_26030 [Alicyclobacillus curvatus]|nr:hypothetical protein JZ785_26030 [Alicyclobacillus curvatus]
MAWRQQGIDGIDGVDGVDGVDGKSTSLEITVSAADVHAVLTASGLPRRLEQL